MKNEQDETAFLAQKLALQLVLNVGGLTRAGSSVGERIIDLLDEIGLEEHAFKKHPISTWRSLLEPKLRRLEKKYSSADTVIHRNIRMLAEELNLTHVDQEILIFVTLLHTSPALEETAELFGRVNTKQMFRVFARLLGVNEKDVAESLRRDGILATAGLVRVDPRGPYAIRCKVEVLSTLTYVLLENMQSTSGLFQHFFLKAPPGELNPDDFAYLGKDLRDIVEHLNSSVAEPRKGSNILLYGEPGTGKTELVRCVAKVVKSQLCEVTMIDSDGDPLCSHQRFAAYRLSQRLLSGSPPTVLLFDEVEDVFARHDRGEMGRFGERNVGEHKAWVNRQLEENPVPAIWVCNRINQIDPAFLRRFDLIKEMPQPPAPVRRKIIADSALGLKVSERWVSRIAEHKHLRPAMISRAFKVAASFEVDNEADCQQRIENVLNGPLHAMGLPELRNSKPSATLDYNIDNINTDADLPKIMRGLQNTRSARLCFYGAPGTGKTALGKHIATQLGCEHLIKRGSDLLKAYVGETEEQIASAFREAESQGAVLQIDEGDSFLRDRRQLDRNWEVGHVNELLGQMEAFDEGIFVLSTNLMDHLDQATLRRFDFKIEFRYPTLEQRLELFRNALALGSQTVLDATVIKEIATIMNVTPGDFAVCMRKARFEDGPISPEWLLDALREEVRHKEQVSRTIGFHAA